MTTEIVLALVAAVFGFFVATFRQKAKDENKRVKSREQKRKVDEIVESQDDENLIDILKRRND